MPAAREVEGKPAALPDGGKPVGAVLAAIAILRFLRGLAKPARLMRISRGTGVTASSCLNILKTLQADGLVSFDPLSKTYRLGPGLWELAGHRHGKEDQMQTYAREMESIARRYGVTITVWHAISEHRKMLSSHALPPGAVRIELEVGQRLPLFAGATGLAFAAFGPWSDQQFLELFDRAWPDRARLPDFTTSVASLRRQGWLLSLREPPSGVATIVVPALDSSGHAIMSVAATAFTDDPAFSRSAEIAVALNRLARWLDLDSPQIEAANG